MKRPLAESPSLLIINSMRTIWRSLPSRPMPRSDEALLGAFVRERCESSFAELVERHGGMVMGVCRRILGCAQDAEEAFQATFLVLARKAGGLRRPGALGPWLFGVARRVALKARGRRRPMQSLSSLEEMTRKEANPAANATEQEMRELWPIVDAEIDRLPAPYRTALILCRLEGRTKMEAARLLGCPEGTISSRLMRAQALLRARLLRRGVALAALAALESTLAPAGVSAHLVQQTSGAAVAMVSGAALTAGAISPAAFSLAQGVSQAMLLTKLKLMTAGLVLVAGLSAGTGLVLGGWGQNPGSQAGARGIAQGVQPAVPSKTAPERKNSSDDDQREVQVKSAPEVRQILKSPTNKFDKRFNEPSTLSENMDFVHRVHGILSVVDIEAFRLSLPEVRMEDVLNAPITLPRMPGESLDAILRAGLAQVKVGDEHVPATYMMRNGTLYIVPKQFVGNAADSLTIALDGKAQRTTVAEALDQLAESTGVTIILDPRAEESARAAEVKSTIRNMKLISAVRVLANMAELSVMDLDGALYVSRRDNIAGLQQEIDGPPLTVESTPLVKPAGQPVPAKPMDTAAKKP